jgi:hypothetical protein
MNDNNNINYNCNFCNKSYKSFSSLNHHQKTAKFCIQLQNREVKQEEKFICNYCNKDFTVKYTYQTHINICKEKKVLEENNTQKIIDQLKEENQKLKDSFIQLKEEISNLKLEIKLKDEQIVKLEKTNNELVKRPTSVINNTDNRKTQYNIQFNQLFEKLDILNESNVNKRINNISSKDQISEYNVENFTYEFVDKLIHALKDLAFCTDQSRRTVVYKDENSKSIKMSVEEMLAKCLELGSEGIKTHFTLTEQVVDDRINNSDESLTSEMLDKFEDQIKELRQFILENDGIIDLKDKKNPLKKIGISFIKTIEQHYKHN